MAHGGPGPGLDQLPALRRPEVLVLRSGRRPEEVRGLRQGQVPAGLPRVPAVLPPQNDRREPLPGQGVQPLHQPHQNPPQAGRVRDHLRQRLPPRLQLRLQHGRGGQLRHAQLALPLPQVRQLQVPQGQRPHRPALLLPEPRPKFANQSPSTSKCPSTRPVCGSSRRRRTAANRPSRRARRSPKGAPRRPESPESRRRPRSGASASRRLGSRRRSREAVGPSGPQRASRERIRLPADSSTVCE